MIICGAASVRLGPVDEEHVGIALKPKPTSSFDVIYKGDGPKRVYTYSGDITPDTDHCPPLP